MRDRGGGTTQAATADSRLVSAPALWLAEVEDSELAAGTEWLYRLAVDSYILPGLGELRLREVTVPAVDRLPSHLTCQPVAPSGGGGTRDVAVLWQTSPP